jgi:hypothetical protein
METNDIDRLALKLYQRSSRTEKSTDFIESIHKYSQMIRQYVDYVNCLGCLEPSPEDGNPICSESEARFVVANRKPQIRTVWFKTCSERRCTLTYIRRVLCQAHSPVRLMKHCSCPGT